MYFHLTARLRLGAQRLTGLRAAWLWKGLRRGFPLAVATVLMPDHLHLIAPLDGAGPRRHPLARLLQHHTRRFGGPGWMAAPLRGEIPDRHHLGRQVRYVALNPCRARFAVDPLRWLWSTHRDVVGATANPWVTADRLADALGRPRRGFRRNHHAYVAGDPHVAAGADGLPRADSSADASLDAIRTAACAATRYLGEAGPGRRRTAALFLATARSVRYPIDHCLREVGIPSRTAYHWSMKPDTAAVAAARLCLADDRLVTPLDAAVGDVDLRRRRRFAK